MRKVIVVIWCHLATMFVFPPVCLLYNRRMLLEIPSFVGWNPQLIAAWKSLCLLAELHTIVDYHIYVERCFGKLLICLVLWFSWIFLEVSPKKIGALEPFSALSPGDRQGQWGSGARVLGTNQAMEAMVKWYSPCEPLYKNISQFLHDYSCVTHQVGITWVSDATHEIIRTSTVQQGRSTAGWWMA